MVGLHFEWIGGRDRPDSLAPSGGVTVSLMLYHVCHCNGIEIGALLYI